MRSRSVDDEAARAHVPLGRSPGDPPADWRIAIVAACATMIRQQAVQQASALGAALCSSLERGAIVSFLRRGYASQAAPAPLEAPKLPPFDYTPPPYTGPPKEEVLALRKKYLNPGKDYECRSECREACRQPQGAAPLGRAGREGCARCFGSPPHAHAALHRAMPSPC